MTVDATGQTGQVDTGDASPQVGSALAPMDVSFSSAPHGSPVRCHAHNRKGGPCGRYASRGQAVCSAHGSRSPQALKAAAVRSITAKAAALVSANGIEPTTDPVEALLMVSGEMSALSSGLRERVAALGDITVTDKLGAQYVAAELSAYQSALRELGRILVAINRLGLMERRIDIEAERVRIMHEAVRRAIWSDAAGVEDYDAGVRIMQAIDVELRALPVAPTNSTD